MLNNYYEITIRSVLDGPTEYKQNGDKENKPIERTYRRRINFSEVYNYTLGKRAILEIEAKLAIDKFLEEENKI